VQDTKDLTALETGLPFPPLSFSIAPTVGIVARAAPHRSAPARHRRHCGGRAGHGPLTRIGVDTAYATHVLPSLILVGIGFGLTLAPSFATATFGVPARDSGVASAMVNVSQQVGVSIATALLSALAASAATDFLTIAGPAPRWCARDAVDATSPRSGRPRRLHGRRAGLRKPPAIRRAA
jgi:hypothetical protein